MIPAARAASKRSSTASANSGSRRGKAPSRPLKDEEQKLFPPAHQSNSGSPRCRRLKPRLRRCIGCASPRGRIPKSARSRATFLNPRNSAPLIPRRRRRRPLIPRRVAPGVKAPAARPTPLPRRCMAPGLALGAVRLIPTAPKSADTDYSSSSSGSSSGNHAWLNSSSPNSSSTISGAPAAIGVEGKEVPTD